MYTYFFQARVDDRTVSQPNKGTITWGICAELFHCPFCLLVLQYSEVYKNKPLTLWVGFFCRNNVTEY